MICKTEEIKTTKDYANRVIKKRGGVVNQTFAKMMVALGYDIKLRYVERGNDTDEF